MESSLLAKNKRNENEVPKNAVLESFIFKEAMKATGEFLYIPSPASGKPMLALPHESYLIFHTIVGALTKEYFLSINKKHINRNKPSRKPHKEHLRHPAKAIISLL